MQSLPSGLSPWKTGLQNRTPRIGNQESGIRNQESGIRNQESGIRNQESGISNQQSAIRAADVELMTPESRPLNATCRVCLPDFHGGRLDFRIAPRELAIRHP